LAIPDKSLNTTFINLLARDGQVLIFVPDTGFDYPSSPEIWNMARSRFCWIVLLLQLK